MSMRPQLNVAVDAMGGYGGVEPVVQAIAQLSLQAKARQRDVYFTLVGDEAQIGSVLLETRHNPERISVVHAHDVVGVSEPPASAIARHPHASIVEACAMVSRGDADAVVTTGNPGAAVVAAFRHFDMIPGIARAALATVYPTLLPRAGDRFSLILDVGATTRATADELVQFAMMGSAYATIISGNDNPRVALLSMTREGELGPTEIVRAHRALQEIDRIRFVGNVEGHQLARGDADVIVCEGLLGDVAIKVMEGLAETAFEIAEDAYQRKFSYRVGLRLLSEGLRKIKTAVDFEEYGGAPLLGIDRVLIVADPRSGARAVENATKLAVKSVRADLPTAIASMLR